MDSQRDNLGILGLCARALSIALALYWALFAILAPVTIWDSHVYNLGRVPITELGGLFGNKLWTSERQLAFPWAFDSIHLPFLHLGWGFGIPSYLCLVGVLAVAWSLLRRSHDGATAWVGVLALLALPTLAFQGVGTKNDVPVLFGIAAWLHALMSWKDTSRRRYLVLAATALGFAAGAKTSGIAPAAFCAGVSLVVLRRNLRSALVFCGAMVPALLFLGSTETYIESFRQFGSPLGPPAFVQAHRNNDGLRGAAANGMRYAMGNLNFGLEAWQHPNRITPALESVCRHSLAAWGMADAGSRPDFGDAHMHFIKNGADSASDFGPLGTLCMLVFLGALIRWRPRELWWRLCLFAGVSGGALCYSVAWMPWNNRFLMLPFAALAIALVSVAREYGGRRRWPLVVVALASGYGAVAHPLLSFNKRPQDLLRALSHRQSQELKERSTMEPVVAAVRAWHGNQLGQELWLLAGSDSWVLPFFYWDSLRVRLVTTKDLPRMIASQPPEKQPALLVLNRPDFRRAELPQARLLQRFAEENDTALFQINTGPASARHPEVIPGANLYPDGWTASTFSVEIEHWNEAAARMEVWNPTPLKRAVSIKSTVESVSLDLEPNQRESVWVRVLEYDTIEGTVEPGFAPGGAETRTLGIHLSVDVP